MKLFQRSLAISAIALSISTQSIALEAPENTSKKPDTFVGLEYYTGDSTLESEFSGAINGKSEIDFDFDGYKIKFGKLQGNGFRFQAYAFFEDSEKAFEEGTYGFGADLIKTFELGLPFQPFLMGGATVGSTKLEDTPTVDYVDERLSAIGLSAGLGSYIKVGRNIELYLGYDYKYRTWQEIKYIGGSGTITLEQEDTGSSLFGGLNYFF